ncbi:MAG: peroxiredoxin, partial [Micrococcus luteus]
MAEPPSGGTRGADVVPALRDDHGQTWPWPPTRGPQDAAGPRGTWLVFLPGAFTPVCTDELGWIGALAEDVAVDDVAVRVVSCDAAPVLRRVREELALPEPLTLLSDFWPHGAACRA